jgi:hypothetical protein
MKRKIMYICDECGKESEYSHEIELCEAGHLGLTIMQYGRYMELKEAAAKLSYIMNYAKYSKSKNTQYDNLIRNIKDFEKNFNVKILEEGK